MAKLVTKILEAFLSLCHVAKHGLAKFWFALVLIIIWFVTKYFDRATILVMLKFGKVYRVQHQTGPTLHNSLM